MKQFLIFVLAVALLLGMLTACTKENTDGVIPEIPSDNSHSGSSGSTATIPTVPQEFSEIPGNYYSAANEQGTLVELNYST